MVRKYLGRRKIEMVQIKSKQKLMVTYSKRRNHLLKKASELSTFCDAHVALFIFSPSGKLSSFGLPSFHHSSSSPYFTPDYFGVSQKKDYIQFLNDRFTQVMDETEKEQRNKKMLLQNERESTNTEKWWTKSPKDMNLSELTWMKNCLEVMKKELDDVRTSQFLQTNPFYVGSSSNVAAPLTVLNGGNIATNDMDLFDQNGMVTTPIDHMLPFGFDSMNGTSSGYNNHSQIQNQVFKQAHPHHGPRFY